MLLFSLRTPVYVPMLCSLLLSCSIGVENGTESEPHEISKAPEIKAAPAAKSSEHLNTHLPKDWLKVLENTTKNLSIVEYIPSPTPSTIAAPNRQTSEAKGWQQKISIEAMSGSGLPDPLTFVDGWAQDQAELCEKFSDNPIFTGLENGYQTVVRLLQCHANKRTKKPIVTMIKVIKGNEALYTITRIWRLDLPTEAQAAKGELPLDEADVANWSDSLRKTIVCDPTAVAHPCPEENTGS